MYLMQVLSETRYKLEASVSELKSKLQVADDVSLNYSTSPPFFTSPAHPATSMWKFIDVLLLDEYVVAWITVEHVHIVCY